MPFPVVNHENVVVFPSAIHSPVHASSSSSKSIPVSPASDSISVVLLPISSTPAGLVSNSGNASEVDSPAVDSFNPECISVILHIPDMNLHPMQTRSKSGIIKKKTVCLATSAVSPAVDLNVVEPSSYKTALTSPVWLKTMKDEIDALQSQQTWKLMPLLSDKNPVGCKWIFKIKRHADGTIARHGLLRRDLVKSLTGLW